MISGYSTSVMLTESGALFRAGVKHKYVNSLNCLQYIKHIENQKKRDLSNIEIKNIFHNKSIMCNYGQFKTYKITDVIFDTCPEELYIDYRVDDKRKEQITLSKYYSLQYSKELMKTKFIFIYENKQHHIIHLIPELCLLTGMDEEAKANFELKKEMIKISNIDANTRVKKTLEVREFFNCKEKFKYKSSPYDVSQKWGLKIEPTIEEFPGHCIKNPYKIYQNNIVNLDSSNLSKKTELKANDEIISEYSFIIFGKNENIIDKLFSNLKISSESIGISNENIKLEKKIIMKENNLKEWKYKVKEEFFTNNKHKFGIVIVDGFTKSYYNDIKDYFKTLGVLSQFIQESTIKNKTNDVFPKILKQIVAKMNIKLFTIDFNESILKPPSCIVGIESNNKFVSMVMTYDKHLCLYLNAYKEIDVNCSNINTEIGKIIGELLYDLLIKYKQKVNFFPNEMIIYRSGTNESSIKRIIDFESPKIQFIMNKYSPETNYLVCVSISKKDLNLFTKNSNIKDEYEYPKSGLVVDSGFTKADSYEFYLQPCNKSGIPVYYKVIYLKCLEKMPMEILQKITYYLCFYFWNWDNSIKVPSCLKFAEKQLKQIFDYKCEVHPNINDKAYYI